MSSAVGVVQLFPGHVHRGVNVPLANRLEFVVPLAPGHAHWVVNAPVANHLVTVVVQLTPGHVHWVVYAPVANHLGLDKLIWVPQRLGSMVHPQN